MNYAVHRALHARSLHRSGSRLARAIISGALRLFSQLALIAGSAVVSAAQGPGLPEDFPHLIYLADDNLRGDLERMAQFDIVWAPFWSQEGPIEVRLDSLRMLNPEIMRMAYVNAAGKSLPDLGEGHVANQLAAAIHDSWLARNEFGEVVYPSVDLPHVPLINLSSKCPRVNGMTWGEFLADFVPLEILSSGKWESVYFDNIWSAAQWVNDYIPGSLDLDRNGVADHPDSVDAWWNAGQAAMLTRFRNNVGPYVPAIGGGNGRIYGPMNGRFFEEFPFRETWTRSMQETADWQTFGLPPSLIVMQTRGPENNYKLMRYGLCSSLIAGTVSCHHSEFQHAGIYPVMYDEYLVDLGRPLGPPVELGVDMIGQTDFEGGVPAQFSTECGPGIGVVTTNPTEVIEGIRSLRGEPEAGYGPWHIYLCSNPQQLPLLANLTYTITFKYRIVQAPPGDGYFFLSARSDVNQTGSARGVINLDLPAGTVGEARAEVTLGNYTGYYLYWGMKNEGRIVIDSIRVTKGRGGVFKREFQNGLALVNPTTTTLVIPIEPGFRRIMGTLDPITNNGLPVNQVALVPEDGLVLVRATAPVDPPDPPESPPPAELLRAYPNPVSMAEESVIEIAGVPPGGGVDIIAPTGRVMRRIESANSAGKWQWDLRHGNGRRAGAGVYFAAIRDAAGGLVGSLRLALHP